MRLNGRAVPTLNSVKDSFFFFTLGSKSGHSSARDYRLRGGWINNAWEYCTAVATTKRDVLLAGRLDWTQYGLPTYTVEMTAPEAYILEATA